MSDFIRVRVKDTGHELSIRADRFDAEVYTKTDKPALGPDGAPLPAKYKTSVDKSAAAKSGQKAESQKENS